MTEFYIRMSCVELSREIGSRVRKRYRRKHEDRLNSAAIIMGDGLGMNRDVFYD